MSPDIEEGRWNRQGRGHLSVEERLCPCGQIQIELQLTIFSLRLSLTGRELQIGEGEV